MKYFIKKLCIFSVPVLLTGGFFILELICPFDIIDYKVNKAIYGDIPAIEAAIDSFFIDTKRYPFTDEGLTVLVTKPREPVFNWRPYLKKIGSDPWGNDYIYKSERQHNVNYIIYSMGPDGKDNNGKHDDVVNWDKDYNCNFYGTCSKPCDVAINIYMIILLISWVFLIVYLVYVIIKYIYKRVRSE